MVEIGVVTLVTLSLAGSVFALCCPPAERGCTHATRGCDDESSPRLAASGHCGPASPATIGGTCCAAVHTGALEAVPTVGVPSLALPVDPAGSADLALTPRSVSAIAATVPVTTPPRSPILRL